MADEGYEVMGPSGVPAAPAAPAAKPAIPAFPVSGGNAGPPPTANIPQFPTASQGAGAPPLKKASTTDNKQAVSVVDKPSAMESKSTIGGGDTKKKNSKKNKKSNAPDTEASRMDDDPTNTAFQRPSSMDTCQLALLIFMTVLIIAISIPVLLTATGSADIEFIKLKLAKV